MFRNKKVVAVLWAMVIGLGLFFWVTAPDKKPPPPSDGPFPLPPARPPVFRGEPITDYANFVEELNREGYLVEIQENVSQPFFAVSGRALLVDGNRLQVFEFRDAEEAEREARRIPADGSSFPTMIVDWAEPPHFYREGKIIVIYVGGNAGIMNVLQSVLGAQFAGRSGSLGKPARDISHTVLREEDNGLIWNSKVWCETAVIKTFSEWKNVWNGSVSDVPAPPLPAVDFSEEMVIGVENRKLRPKVESILDTADAVIVDLDYKPLPPSSAPVVKNPYLFVKTELVQKPVVFQDLQTVAACRD